MPEKCAQTFMAAFYAGRQPDMTCIDQLCGLALSLDDLVAKRAVCALYGTIIEGLCDDFSSLGVGMCNRVLLCIVANLHAAGKTGSCADDLGLGLPDWEKRLLLRHDALVRQGVKALRMPPAKIIILSRVTIGADVMITSILIQRLRLAFPEAEIVLIGPSHVGALLLFDNKVQSRLFPYERNCSLSERFEATCRLARLVREECQDQEPSRVLLVDPDSRLSQLGLMPLLPVDQSRYFCSRLEMEESDTSSLVEITNRWLDRWLGVGEQQSCYPKIRLAAGDLELARLFMAKIRGDNQRVLLINLGVGRNENKRVPPPFEEELLRTLLRHPHLTVVLDSGYSPAGLARAQNLMRRVEQEGHGVQFVREAELPRFQLEPGGRLIGLRGSIGMIGALINEADCFFGYDSSCQHLANASNIPGVVVFAGYRRARFLARWRPHNSQESISVISLPREEEMDLQRCHDLVEKVTRQLCTCCRMD